MGTPRSLLSVLFRHLAHGWLLLAGVLALAQTIAPESRLKGAFLAKFTQYLEWPSAAFTTVDQPIVIGILGDDSFGAGFDESLRVFKTAGRPLQARRYHKVEEVKGCHILYISPSENRHLEKILEALRGQPVFTAGDQADILKLGGALRFWLDGDQLAFQISTNALREAHIKAHPRLLQLSRDSAKRP